MALLDKSPAQMPDAAKDFDGIEVGQLLTPLTRYADAGGIYGIDNGAYSRFDADDYLGLLRRQWDHRERCKFVAAPDVVADARRTLEAFDHWRSKLTGWPLALVAQDGQEDLAIPWHSIAAIFIGGTTAWKCSDAAIAIAKSGKLMGKWVHVGRVNGSLRFDRFKSARADSFDGTGISRYSWMRRAITEANPLFALHRSESA